MNTLATIQKTFNIFRILTKVGAILSFVWAGLCALGLLCCMVWTSGGSVTGADRELLQTLTATGSLNQMTAVLLSDLIFALTDGKLLLLACRYFRQEQLDGTPFTTGGADRIRSLGIRTIVLPLVAVILSAVICQMLGAPQPDQGNAFSVSTGIVLILASLIFRYGAQLEGK